MSVSHEVKGYKIYFKTPYSDAFIRELRNLRTRYYEGNGENSISIFNESDIVEINKLLKKYFNYNANIDPRIAQGKPFGAARIDNDKVVFKTVMYDEKFNNDLKSTFKNYHFNWNEHTWSVFIASNPDHHLFKKFFNEHRIITKPEFDQDFMKIANLALEMKAKREELVKLSSQSNPPSTFSYNLPDPVLSLYPFQEAGVHYLMQTHGNGLIADEQGLGKTIQALVYLYNEPNKRPILFVVPSHVKYNWIEEIKKWLDLKEDEIYCIEGRKTYDLPLNKQAYVINYDILHNWLEKLITHSFKSVIFDESHYIKEYKSKRTKSAVTLSKKIDSKILLSGTPILNRPIEIWTTIQILGKEADFGNVGLFSFKYCGAFRDERGHLIVEGASNVDELQVKLRSSIMIRRTKKDVLPFLPVKNRMTKCFLLDNQAEYNLVKNNFQSWYKGKTGKIITDAEAIVQMEMLKQASIEGKIRPLIKFILDTIENDNKVVVVVHHRKAIADIEAGLLKANIEVFKVIGGETAEQKKDNVDKFNAAKKAACICSLKGGTTGINLQTASTLIFTEYGWTPGEHDQAEDRIHRIGQDHICNYYYCISPGTIDDLIWKILKEKREIIEKSTDGMIVENEKSRSFIKDVLDEMKKD